MRRNLSLNTIVDEWNALSNQDIRLDYSSESFGRLNIFADGNDQREQVNVLHRRTNTFGLMTCATFLISLGSSYVLYLSVSQTISCM